MTQSPLVTLTAGVAGAVVGLLSPVVAASFTRLSATKQAQRVVADDILDLFNDGRPLTALLGGAQSATRRKLFILGLRLRDAAARDACNALVEKAGEPQVSDDELFLAWQQMISKVSRVSRGERKDGSDA